MGEDPDGELDRWQRETAEWRDRLLTAAQASAGYAGAELRREARQLVLYGVGRPTTAISALIREAAPSLEAVWHEASYTCAELDAEVQRLMRQEPGRLSSAGPLHDGSGIHIMTTDPALLLADDPQAELRARYPITVEHGERPVAI